MNIYSSFKHRKNKTIQYFNPGCLILCYHRVGNDVNDKWGNSVSVENFNYHMQFIARNNQTLPINEIQNALKIGKLPFRRSIVVTFDDGYEINLEYACDILNKYRIPATFYMNSYTLGTDNLFWWDELQLFFSDKKKLPEEITLSINGIDINLLLKTPIKLDHSFYMIHRLLKGLNEQNRLSLIHMIYEQIKNDFNIPIELQPISKKGLNQIASHDLFTIGGHSHSHIALGLNTVSDQEFEIKKNKEILENIIHKTLYHFSYPFGSDIDYDNHTIDILKNSGYVTAVMTLKKLLRQDSDPYQIPRFSIKNWDKNTFEKKMNNYMNY